MDKEYERMFKCVWCKYDFKESDANFILSENPNECVCSSCMTEWADNLLWDFKRKEQECEELKKELKNVYDDCKGCPTCNEALYNANLYAKEYRKLKQTLAEIEKYLDAQQKYFDGEDYHDLLDIINKVKEK